MDNFYYFLEWLDNWEGVERIAFAGVGYAFLSLIWVWGYRCGRRRWWGAARKASKNTDTICAMAQDIIHGYNTSDKIKVHSIDRLTRKERI